MVVPESTRKLFWYQKIYERDDGVMVASNVKHKRRPLAEVTKFFVIHATRKWSIDIPLEGVMVPARSPNSTP